MAKLPAILFYTGDWMKAPEVRALSYAAKGLWIDMLCIMSEATPRGYLTLNATPLELDTLARMTGGSTAEVSRLVTELESAGVFSRDRHGILYSRRMVRDEKDRELARGYGRLGGNPALLRQPLSPPLKPDLKMKVKMNSGNGEGSGGENPTVARILAEREASRVAK